MSAAFCSAVLASAFIIVSEDNDVPTREVRFASSRKAIAGTAERDGNAPRRTIVSASFRPLASTRSSSANSESKGSYRAVGYQTIVGRLAILPANHTVRGDNAINVEPVAATRSWFDLDLDPPGLSFNSIDVTPNFIGSYGRTFLAIL